MKRNADFAQIQQQAAEWVLRFSEVEKDSEDAQLLHKEWQQWCLSDARHPVVYHQMQQLWASAAITPAATARKSGASRYVALAIFIAGGWLLSQLPYTYWLADQHTVAGEVRRIVLDDGSGLILNSNSAVNISFTSQKRTITLLRGEVYAQVAKDPYSRPFVIDSTQITAQALGTRYSVRDTGKDTLVSVDESHVRVTANDNSNLHLDLNAGQQVGLDRLHITRPVSASTEAGWIHNQLVFENAPLIQVVDELSRHYSGLIYLDPRQRQALEHLHFTGVLPLNDSQQALELLKHSLPISVRQPFGYLVWISENKNH
ncbi:FecR family protein [Pectobacterium fontis]|uniref:Iron dicitrate transport regulator FecR n=1 Tax=Pectobacterium fontis TaxID=2558042 RepID=A0A7V8IJE7_9GAMM|nr:FecR domain-containing protein [Pectobacterium fontis]KHN52316.1 iron dicitrate transport regulator FecR [Pectobacterium fontis]